MNGVDEHELLNKAEGSTAESRRQHASSESGRQHASSESRRRHASTERVPAADLVQPLLPQTRPPGTTKDAAMDVAAKSNDTTLSDATYDYVAAALGRAPMSADVTRTSDAAGGDDDELNTTFADRLRLEELRREAKDAEARRETQQRPRVTKISELPPADTRPKHVSHCVYCA